MNQKEYIENLQILDNIDIGEIYENWEVIKRNYSNGLFTCRCINCGNTKDFSDYIFRTKSRRKKMKCGHCERLSKVMKFYRKRIEGYYIKDFLFKGNALYCTYINSNKEEHTVSWIKFMDRVNKKAKSRDKK